MADDEKPLMGKEKKKDPPKEEEKKGGMVPGMPDINCCDCCSCCDCDCEKHEEESKGQVCCCCWPISSGITFIGIFASAWLAYAVVDTFMLFFNEFVDGYFVFGMWVGLIPAIIGIIFYWIYADGKKKSHRMLGVYALAMFWISVVLQTGW